MKILLNLLPEEKKLEIQRTLHGRFLLWQLFLLLLLEVFFLGMLLAVSFILSFQHNAIRNTTNQEGVVPIEESLLSRYETKFRGTNEAVDVIGKIEGNHVYFTQVFRLLDREQPEGVKLKDLRSKDRTITLLGTADTRETFLVFEGRLKNSACIESVSVPLSNLFSERNVDFQIDFTLKLDCLHQNSL